MKRTLLVLCLLLAGAAFAKDWHPFLGIGPAIGYFSLPLTGTTEAMGKQFEVGIRHLRHEFYFTYTYLGSEENIEERIYSYSIDAFTTIRSYELENESGTEDRVLIGYRYWPDIAQSRIKPIIGAAIGSGESKVTRRNESWKLQYLVDPDTHRTVSDVLLDHKSDNSGSRNSTFCLTTQLEFGISYRIVPPISLLALTQLQADFLTYKHSGSREDGGINLFLYPTIALQLRYTL